MADNKTGPVAGPTSVALGPRIVSLDAARGVAILLVVVGHALEVLFIARPDGAFSVPAFSLWRTIYAFHMPLFFVLAGMVRREGEEPLEKVWGRTLGLILLAEGWHLVGCAVRLGQLMLSHAPAAELQMLMITTLRPFVIGAGFQQPSLWFLVALGLTELLAAVLRGKSVTGRVVMAAALAALMNLPGDVGAIWQAHSLGPALLFFVAGAALRRLGWEWTRLAALPCLLLTPAMAAFNLGCPSVSEHWCPAADLSGRFAVSMALGRFGFAPLFLTAAAFGCIAVIGVSKLAEARAPARALAAIGRQSLAIYLVNGYLLTFANPVLRAILPADAGLLKIAAICGCAVVANLLLAVSLRRVANGSRTLAQSLADRLMQAQPRRSAKALGA